jgi:prophage antirepressor-like protein
LSDIVPFTFQGAEVRTLMINDEPWWVAADVAAVLEFRMASDATRSLDEDEKGYAEVRTPGGLQRVAVINEPGLYRMIFRSRSAEAKQFQRWVAHDVLPQLRKTGHYEVAQQQAAPLAIEQAAIAKAQMEVLGAAKQFSVVNDSYLEACAREIIAEVRGQIPQQDPQDRTIDVQTYLADRGLTGKTLRSARTVFGKALTAAYRRKYGKDPQKIDKLVDGMHRKVAVYTHRDIDLFHEAWAEVGPRYLGGAA